MTQTFKETISITFGDVAENHVGMQKVGTIADTGFTFDDLSQAKLWFETNGATTQLIPLHTYLPEHLHQNQDLHAWILIVKNAANALMQDHNAADILFSEQKNLDTDKKVKMYGKVLNKHARHNLCFGEQHQEPDYDSGKGRIYAFHEVPALQTLRNLLCQIMGDNKSHNLQAEGNYYFDVNKCGIGYHGDAERKKVIAMRLGATMPLHYIWYKNGLPVTQEIVIDHLQHGDIYIMSQKTTGFDWKKRTIYTLRHAAGARKYTLPKTMIKKQTKKNNDNK